MRHAMRFALLVGCGDHSELLNEPPNNADVADATGEDVAADAADEEAAPDAASQASGHDAVVDASSGPLACSERDDACPLENGENPLWGHILAAKQACDGAPFHWQCGDLRASVDEHGCVTKFWVEYTDLPDGYGDCVVEQLATQRFSCLANSTQRSYESCTLL